MPKPKVYIDKDGSITIVFPKETKKTNCTVTLVHDRGVEFTKQRSFFNFNENLPRFVYHIANAYGDSGHCSYDNTYTKDFLGTEYKLIKK